jgi:2-hydroxychromene-2-carboxylate isomerase
MRNVQFHFDFGSPNAYMSHHAIPGIEARTGVKFDYVPVLLGGIFKATGNQSPATAFGHIKNKPEYDRLEMQRFIARHGLTGFRFNPHFPINTLQLMRGAVAAQVAGVFGPYLDAVFADMWERGEKMDDPAVLKARLDAAGLPTEELFRLSQTDEVKGTLIRNTEDSVARGAFGIPTFFVGQEIFFGKDRLREVEEEIAGQGAA